MTRATRSLLPSLAAALFLCGCPSPPIKSAADVRVEQLPSDPAELNKQAAELIKKGDVVSLENALVVSDRALTLSTAPAATASAAAANPSAYEAAWLGAEASFLLGFLAEEDKHRRAWFAEKGMAYSRRSVTLRPDGAEGHYYLALNTANLARTRTIGALQLLPEIVKEARAAVAANAKIDHCGPLRLLGTVLLRAPSWPTSVGDVEDSADTLSRAVTECPEHPGNHLFYGEALIANKKRDQAGPELEKALQAPSDPDWAPMQTQIHAEAQQQLDKLRK